jgi:hypothetical protein
VQAALLGTMVFLAAWMLAEISARLPFALWWIAAFSCMLLVPDSLQPENFHKSEGQTSTFHTAPYQLPAGKMRLTADLINSSLSYLNPNKERELDLRGAFLKRADTTL